MNDTAETSTQPAAKSTSETQPKWRAWRAFLVCQVWAFVLFLPLNQRITSEHNRYFLNWTSAKLLVFFLATAIVGLFLFLISLVIRRLVSRGYEALAATMVLVSLLFFVCGFLTDRMAREYVPIAVSPFPILLAAGVIVACQKFKIGLTQIHKWLCNCALLLVFLLPIFWISHLFHYTYPKDGDYATLEQLAKRSNPKEPLFPADNVYLFIFDGWSYPLMMDDDGLPKKVFPNFRKFAQEACVFSNAHSPGCHTLQSLPRYLYERTDLYCVQNGNPGFWKNNKFLPCSKCANIFTNARKRGFTTYMVGWSHPYATILKKDVDYCYSIHAINWIGDSTAESLRTMYFDFGQMFCGPFISRELGFPKALMVNSSHLDQVTRLFGKTESILKDDHKKGQFAAFHLPLPHPPFIFRSDTKMRDLRQMSPPSSRSDYTEQCIFLDHVIGKLIGELKKRNKYDNSMIIFATDHTFRFDPTLKRTAANISHIPLLLRFPKQKELIPVAAKFTTSNLFRLADAMSVSQSRAHNINKIIEQNHWYYQVPESEAPLPKLTIK